MEANAAPKPKTVSEILNAKSTSGKQPPQRRLLLFTPDGKLVIDCLIFSEQSSTEVSVKVSRRSVSGAEREPWKQIGNITGLFMTF